MPAAESAAIAAELDLLRQQGQFRELRPLEELGGRLHHAGRDWLNLSSNDYLDLARHPAVREGAIRAIERWGTGATASRLMAGTTTLHEELEEALARFFGWPAALVAGSGFLVNLGVLSALAGAGDFIAADKLNHASLIDGMRLSGATWKRYAHNDAAAAARLLAAQGTARRRLLVTDSVFSMDGDIAPLPALAAAARDHGALLIADEAHAIGVLGPGGRGVVASLDPADRPAAVLATMSKSLGSYGGILLCDAPLRDLVINRGRSFIFSTGLPPASAGAALAALRVIEGDPTMGDRLMARVRCLYNALRAAGLAVEQPQSQIMAVMVGDNHRAVELAGRLREAGILATAIRPPTVPPGTARLRLSVTLAHGEEELATAATTIAREARAVGVPCA
jgi:8-amino-7-oxononanoate synthase